MARSRWIQAQRSFLTRVSSRLDVQTIVSRLNQEACPVSRVLYWPPRSTNGSDGRCLVETKSAEKMVEAFQQVGIKPSINSKYRSASSFSFYYTIFNYMDKNWTGKERKRFGESGVRIQEQMCQSHEQLVGQLEHCADLSAQIDALHRYTSLTDGDLRLRYLLACCLQRTLPDKSYVSVIGSASTGLGWAGSDLDLSVSQLGVDQDRRGAVLKRLSYRLRALDPGMTDCANFGGLVPVFNFHHELLGFSGDVSLNNDTGLAMAQLLSTCARSFQPLRSLLFALKSILKTEKILLEQHTPNFSSFKFLVLLLHYLQHQGHIPPLVNITDLKSAAPNAAHTSLSNQKLLLGFLDYLINDFKPSEHIISLATGSVETRLRCPIAGTWKNESYLDCPNPCDPSQNMTRNISKKDWNRVLNMFSSVRERLLVTREEGGPAWGLIPFLVNQEKRLNKKSQPPPAKKVERQK